MFCFVSGERRTVVSCMKIINKTMTQVNNSYCQVENRPSPQIRPCNLHPCQYRYQLHHIFSKLSVLPDICVSCAFLCRQLTQNSIGGQTSHALRVESLCFGTDSTNKFLWKMFPTNLHSLTGQKTSKHNT